MSLTPAPIGSDSTKWTAVSSRDPAADGAFVYSVKTTGVYCRPSCPSRPARPAHIAFHATCAEAEAAGFRACKRCRPNEASRETRRLEAVTRACRLMDEAESMLSLETLADAAGLGVSHFHRLFRSATGVTPRAYGEARRAARMTQGLRAAATVTTAIYDSGFASASRFYEAATGRLGMSPTAYRKGGAGETIRYATGASTLGALLVAATDKGLCAVLLGDAPDALALDLANRFPRATLASGDAAFATLVTTVIDFVESPGKGLDLPLDISGTAFQQRVWQALRAIPPGTTATYTEVARAIGQPRAVRAVASACGANSIAVAIPCHRVLRADGSLSGYRWGVDRKKALLAREGRTMSGGDG